MPARTIQFLAVMTMAIALIPAGAHLFALPNKIHLDQEQYFTVQSIYRGWAWFGVVFAAALLANVGLAVSLRGQGAPFWLALVGITVVVLVLAVFFVWTYPANVATDNWTAIPPNWQSLRNQWEYSHAANAIFLMIGFCAVALALLTARN